MILRSFIKKGLVDQLNDWTESDLERDKFKARVNDEKYDKTWCV